jgi:hypothetical protein
MLECENATEYPRKFLRYVVSSRAGVGYHNCGSNAKLLRNACGCAQVYDIGVHFTVQLNFNAPLLFYKWNL